MSAARKAAFNALVRYASSSSARLSRGRGKPRPSAAATASSAEAPPSPSSSPVPATTSGRDDWVEVKDPQSNQIYYWNRSTDETTAIGEPRPGPDWRRRQVALQSSSGGGLISMIAMGAGVGLVFALISRIF